MLCHNCQHDPSASTMIAIPPPDEIARRMAACKAELKALMRLNRMSRAAKSAAEARESRIKATKRLWCPTWLDCENGPIDLCEHHAGVFQVENNPNANNGSWHWGEEADKAFQSCEAFFPRNDERNQNIKGMLANGTKINHHLTVVDGKVWLTNKAIGIDEEWYVRLGDYPDVKDIFPALFAKPV